MVCDRPDLNDLIEATLLRNICNIFYSGLTWGTGMTDKKSDVTGVY